ncbi:allatostatin-A receptor-like [Littorina saxatilis]|uniref:allatostatin-A receptor-like n=1 Tax=Littorina saxatilis TaxID=31220 RepID=UPI0038B4CEF7
MSIYIAQHHIFTIMTSTTVESTDWPGDVSTINLTYSTFSNSMNSTGSSSDDAMSAAELERNVSIVVPTVFGVIFLLGLLGNMLVILVVALDKNMRNTTNILILMLAVADLLFIIFCVPFTATSYAMPVWPFGRAWCKMMQYLTFVSAYASVYTLVLMSLDRYLAVVHAIRSMSIRTECNTWLAIGVVWAVILASNVPILLQYDVLGYKHDTDDRSVCINVHHQQDEDMGVVYYSCFLAFGYVLPLGATCLMYGLMLKRLHGSAPGGKTNKSQESMRAKRRVTKMVVIIVAVFAVCWLPIQVILLAQHLGVPFPTVPLISLQLASNCLAYMNSCVNPILYAFLSENFRRSFRKILCCSSPVSRRAEYELVSVKQTENVTAMENVTTATGLKSSI